MTLGGLYTAAERIKFGRKKKKKMCGAYPLVGYCGFILNKLPLPKKSFLNKLPLPKIAKLALLRVLFMTKNCLSTLHPYIGSLILDFHWGEMHAENIYICI